MRAAAAVAVAGLVLLAGRAPSSLAARGEPGGQVQPPPSAATAKAPPPSPTKRRPRLRLGTPIRIDVRGHRPAPWSRALREHIEQLREHRDGDIAVYAHDLSRDLSFGFQADRPMYLASGVKLLFLLELYRQREAGQLSFDETLLYTRDDVRDGASSMNRERIGRRYPVHQLVTYMVRDSDNAATDLLLQRIGLREVERTLAREGLRGFGPLVNMMDVRREVYRRLDPRADELDAVEVRDVRWRDGYHPRLDLLKKHIGPPYGDYDESDLEVAYDGYYALKRNHGSMRGMGRVLARLVDEDLLSPRSSRAILSRLDDVWTSGHRIRGAIPSSLRVAHKTGTQHRRIVDLAVVWLEDDTPLVLCIAVQDLPHEEAEALLQSVAARAFDLANDHASSHPTRKPSLALHKEAARRR